MNKTKKLIRDEKELQLKANWLYHQKVRMIIETYKMCHPTLSQFCIYNHISISTFHKYENNECCMSSERFFQLCIFLKRYVTTHSLSNKEEIMQKIDQIMRIDVD